MAIEKISREKAQLKKYLSGKHQVQAVPEISADCEPDEYLVKFYSRSGQQFETMAYFTIEELDDAMHNWAEVEKWVITQDLVDRSTMYSRSYFAKYDL